MNETHEMKSRFGNIQFSVTASGSIILTQMPSEAIGPALPSSEIVAIEKENIPELFALIARLYLSGGK